MAFKLNAISFVNIRSFFISFIGISTLIKPDYVNAGFEFVAGLFILNNCRILCKQKLVRGVSVVSTTFFFLWGCWNTWWFKYIEKPYSFSAGLFVMLTNCLWIALMLYYNHREKANSCQSSRDPR